MIDERVSNSVIRSETVTTIGAGITQRPLEFQHQIMATASTIARALGLRAAPSAAAAASTRRSAARRSQLLSPAAELMAAGRLSPCWPSSLLPSFVIQQQGASANGSGLAQRFSTARRAHVAAASAAEAVPMVPESTVDVSLTEGELMAWEGDLLALGVYEGSIEKEDSGALKDAALKKIDDALGGVLSELLEDEDFKAGAGSSKFVRIGSKARYFGLVGLGAEDKAATGTVPEWGASPWQAAGSAVADAAKSHKAKAAGFALVGGASLAADQVEKLALGVLLGGFESTRFKSKPKPSSLASLQILSSGDSASIARAAAMARGVMLTRLLVEAPPNVANPTHLAEAAALIASEFPEVMSLEVLEKEDCYKLGMGCFLGVAEASETPLKFIHLTYSPAGGDAKRKIAVVGKGLTFDSGGYNLKAGPGSMIEQMKFDMGGSGATLGAAMATAGLAPKDIEVHFIVASCENMIDGKGLRPGDIITASNGKTVEVNNTDAEGRLTLADALLFAQEQCKAEAIVDVATLTGACIVALGPSIAGLMTPNEDMAERVTSASKAAGEKVWRLPLESEYMEQLKSPIADMVNTGSRFGGSITAGLFLKEFINEVGILPPTGQSKLHP
mmetsp:Transcript_38753/g.109579  ORF Transcript_38753/g.109579 Transcript_38753/m.109579 type:complete len:618 (+) Transcript_38753:3-1856(+)